MDKKREKKNFNDLFEWKDTVAKNSAYDEGRWALWRIFWARPVDHLDDKDLETKKAYEKKFAFGGFYKGVVEDGEDMLARKVGDHSRWGYFREHMGGLFGLQMVIELVITVGAFLLLRFKYVDRQCLHASWNEFMPSLLELDLALTPENEWKEPNEWLIRQSADQMNDWHTAHAIGTYTIPLQFALTWVLFPPVLRYTNSLQWLQKLRKVVKQAQDEAERAAKRKKF